MKSLVTKISDVHAFGCISESSMVDMEKLSVNFLNVFEPLTWPVFAKYFASSSMKFLADVIESGR
jgi:hypothetical protein